MADEKARGSSLEASHNVYWVDGGLYERYSYDPPDYEANYLRGVFVAETPAQAKRDALREFNNDCEWLDLRVRLLVKGIDLPRGVFDEDCPEGPWDDPDSGIDPPEPWASVWLALDKVLAAVTE
jgi:hypothetical protein